MDVSIQSNKKLIMAEWCFNKDVSGFLRIHFIRARIHMAVETFPSAIEGVYKSYIYIYIYIVKKTVEQW